MRHLLRLCWIRLTSSSLGPALALSQTLRRLRVRFIDRGVLEIGKVPDHIHAGMLVQLAPRSARGRSHLVVLSVISRGDRPQGLDPRRGLVHGPKTVLDPRQIEREGSSGGGASIRSRVADYARDDATQNEERVRRRHPQPC